jgi:hypothetical protein
MPDPDEIEEQSMRAAEEAKENEREENRKRMAAKQKVKGLGECAAAAVRLHWHRNVNIGSSASSRDSSSYGVVPVSGVIVVTRAWVSARLRLCGCIQIGSSDSSDGVVTVLVTKAR